MKLVFLLAAVIGIAYAAPMNNELLADFKDFLFALPIKAIREIIHDHVENDPEFKAALKYIQSGEFKKRLDTINKKPSVKEARTIIIEAGVDLEWFERLAQGYLDTFQIEVSPTQKRSFGKVITKIDAIMPYQKLLDMLTDKLENSAAFKKFFDSVSSERMHQLADKILNSEEVNMLVKDFVAMDVPMYKIIDAAYVILGWKDMDKSPNDLE